MSGESGKKRSAMVLLGDVNVTETKSNEEEDVIRINVSSKQGLSTCLESVPGPLSSIVIHVPSPVASYYDPLALASLVSYLSKDGTVHVHIPSKNNNNDDDDVKVVTNSFLLSSLYAESEWNGQTERILKARLKPPTSSITVPVRTSKVTVTLDDDDDLIDEDDLLVNGLSPPPLMEKRTIPMDDCGGRKACDNCTCGRAERETTQQQSTPPPPSSACGNCSKGDAFRCAGCPYLGKPAFKPGEEHLVLDLTDDL